MSANAGIVPVILSGGSGTRLWPLSRQRRPKQFLNLTAEESLFQLALARAGEPRLFAAPLIVANEAHRFLVGEQLRRMEAGEARLLLEPEGRNTAPAAALAALYLRGQGADPCMLVMPADHAIADIPGFHGAVEEAAEAARDDYLVTFGIQPTHPETGYGYIAAGEPLAGRDGCREVLRFVEKPDRETAEGYLASGGYLWNSGIFLFRASSFLAALSQHAPEMLAVCETAIARATESPDFVRPDGQAFATSPADSIDYAVMEKAQRVAVVPAEIGWSDIGSWSAIWEVLDHDADGNALAGDVIAEDSRGCLLRADGPAIAALGVDDLTVVTTADMVLVLPRERGQEVKRLVERLKAAGRREHIDPPGQSGDGESR